MKRSGSEEPPLSLDDTIQCLRGNPWLLEDGFDSFNQSTGLIENLKYTTAANIYAEPLVSDPTLDEPTWHFHHFLANSSTQVHVQLYKYRYTGGDMSVGII